MLMFPREPNFSREAKTASKRQLIGNRFWPSWALARSLTDRKSTSNRNDLARAVSIHQVPEFQIRGL